MKDLVRRRRGGVVSIQRDDFHGDGVKRILGRRTLKSAVDQNESNLQREEGGKGEEGEKGERREEGEGSEKRGEQSDAAVRNYVTWYIPQLICFI